jgi:hypothetical protein
MAATYDVIMDSVQDRFDTTLEYADSTWQAAEGFLNQLSGVISAYDQSYIDLDYSIDSIATGAYLPTAPDAPADSLTVITKPTEPTLEDVTIGDVEIPTLSASEPTIVIPEVPSVTWPSSPGSAPVFAELEFPSVPSLVFPDAPVLTELALPDMPSTNIISFAGVLPTEEINPVELTFSWEEELYQSTLLDILKNVLQETGGIGWGEEAEEALWQRGQDRQTLVNEKVYNETLNFFSSRGWEIPPGALGVKLTQALTEQTRADAQLNYEILIKQADLGHEYSKFIIQAGLNLEDSLMKYAGEVATRSLTSAKFAQEAAVNVFNAEVAMYNIELDKYKTEATVFELKVKAEQTILQNFKLQLESVALEKEIQTIGLQLYELQLAGLKTRVELYNAEMQGVGVMASVEKLRLDGFSSEVAAYTAMIQGNTARYSAYGSQIQAEGLKASVFSEQVNAYKAHVDAIKTGVEAEATSASIVVEKNKVLVQEYVGNIEMYKAETDVVMKEFDALTARYGVQMEKYSVDTKLAATQIDADIKSYDANMTHEENRLRLNLEEAKVNLAAAQREHELSLKAVEASMNVNAQMAASSLSSVSAVAQMSYRTAAQRNDSESQNISTQTSHIHHYTS